MIAIPSISLKQAILTTHMIRFQLYYNQISSLLYNFFGQKTEIINKFNLAYRFRIFFHKCIDNLRSELSIRNVIYPFHIYLISHLISSWLVFTLYYNFHQLLNFSNSSVFPFQNNPKMLSNSKTIRVSSLPGDVDSDIEQRSL